MGVVVLGDTDSYAEHELVRRAVEDRGEETFVVAVQRWPGGGPIEHPVDDVECVFDEPIPFDEVTGVFSMIQSVFPSFLTGGFDWFDEKPARVAYRQLLEWQRLFRSLIAVFEDRGANVTVSPAHTYWNHTRPWMLELYDRNGVTVPETTFTNEPDRVERFVEEHSKAIVQGVNGGGRPELVSPSDLDEERLARLAAAPIKLQEYVPGRDARAFVVDGEFAGMIRYEYDSDAISIKSPAVDHTDVGSVPFSPDPELRDQVVRAGELSPSAYTAVDVRITDDGEFAVLESNVPGRFAAHDMAGSTDVSGRIAAYLA